MNGVVHLDLDCCEFVEVDPTGRYGRYNEILGKGASKTVYRAFDEYEGIEVAWNQVKLYDFLQSPEDLERLYCEIHLLKTLKHKNIMKFYTSWVDTAKRNINFVTEMFTSGTLRQYRLKHRRVNMRAVKHWCRQILKGLLYLHSHDPPVIHRDLKCDNIFVNGNQGEVKIGDLGLAAILRKSHAAHCVGTPEFMAPEVYEEEYNELVDIYSFGMCILEMVTFEYPYSECTNPAQIYKNVVSGKKPDALYKVKDPEVREFIDKCLATVSSRPSAREILNDSFLQIDDYECDFSPAEYQIEVNGIDHLIRQPLLEHPISDNSCINGYLNGIDFDCYNEWGYHLLEVETNGIELFEHHDDDHPPDVDITIKGKRREDGSIFLRLRITDKEGRVRNIYFPFDIEMDTALSVATEMVAELDITDQDVTSIADMIDGEIASLVPEWKPGPGIEETPRFSRMNLCENCASNHTSMGSFMDFLSNNQHFECCNGCAAMHGRFEEITYHQVEGSENHVTESAPVHHSEIWDRCESVELSSLGSGISHSDEEHKKSSDEANPDKIEINLATKTQNEMNPRGSITQFSSSSSFPMAHFSAAEDYESEVQWELRWVRAKYQLEMREIRDKQTEIASRTGHGEYIEENNAGMLLNSEGDQSSSFRAFLKKSCPDFETQRAQNREAKKDSRQDLAGAKSLFRGSLLPSALHRTTSLPVDAVHI